MTHRTRLAPLALIALAGMATLSAPTWAQQGKQPERRASKEERPVLSGPRVREQRVPGTESGFSADAEASARKTGQPVPVQVFRKAIGQLMAEDAPLAIRLSPEQGERIRAHVRAFEEQMRGQRGGAARQRRGADDRVTDRPSDHAPDRRAPRSDRASDGERPQLDRPQPNRDRPDRSRTDRPQTDRRQTDRMQPDRAQPERDREAPQRSGRVANRGEMARALAGLQNQIWAELSAAQQAHVGKAIEAWRAQAAADRMDRTQERYRKEIGARFDEMESDRPQRKAGDQANPGTGPTELRQWFSQLPEDVQKRLHARMESMPAERREALVARAIEMSPQQRAELLRRLLQSEDRESPRRRPQ